MKKINVNYSGSYVETIDGISIVILVIGLLSSLIVLVYGLNSPNTTALQLFLQIVYILIPSFIMYFLLTAVSRILQHLLCIRAYHEIKAFEAGYEVNNPCYTITEIIPESAEKDVE